MYYSSKLPFSLEYTILKIKKKSLFVSCSDGEGIHLEQDLDKGYSQTCKTFNNSPLVSGDEGRFQCSMIEVLVFEDKVSQENGTSKKWKQCYRRKDDKIAENPIWQLLWKIHYWCWNFIPHREWPWCNNILKKLLHTHVQIFTLLLSFTSPHIFPQTEKGSVSTFPNINDRVTSHPFSMVGYI